MLVIVLLWSYALYGSYFSTLSLSYFMYHIIVTQVFIANTGFIPRQGYHLILQENDENEQRVCLQTNGIVRNPVHIDIKTNHINVTGYTPAIGKSLIIQHIFHFTYLGLNVHLSISC